MRKAERLKLWRKSGWTFRALASATDLTHQTLSNAISGRTAFPDRRVCEVLARAVSTPERPIDADTLFPPRPTAIDLAA